MRRQNLQVTSAASVVQLMSSPALLMRLQSVPVIVMQPRWRTRDRWVLDFDMLTPVVDGDHHKTGKATGQA